MKLTLSFLLAIGASWMCTSIATFRKSFPNGMLINKQNFEILENLGCNINWLFEIVVKQPAREKYEKIQQPAREKYEKISQSAWEEYEKISINFQVILLGEIANWDLQWVEKLEKA